MNITIENILLIGSILLFLSILAGKTSYRFGVPTLIFFLIVGMLAGSEGIGGIYFDDPKLAQFIGIVAFNFILFSGGIETDWKAIKPVLKKGMMLSTLGVLITATSVGVFVYYISDFSFTESMLIGSIVSSTDAAAVFSILRSKSIALKNNLRPLLELESGSNDPMANVLTIVFTGLVVTENASYWGILPFLLAQLLIGAGAGLVFGKLGKEIINRIKLDFDGLYPVLVIALMVFTFSATDFIGGNGFLAVYISAVYLGNKEFIHKKTIIKAFDGFTWLMQIVLFLTLGLLVNPSGMLPIIGIGLLISAFLILVARPLSVFISLSTFKINTRNKIFVSWVGLRGAVPIVFATYPLVAGIDKASLIFNIVFFISLTSVLIQGTTLSYVAKLLHVSLPENLKPITLTDLELNERVKSIQAVIVIPKDSLAIGKSVVELDFPLTAIISIIERTGFFITPNGSTVIQHEDKLTVLAEDSTCLFRVYQSVDAELPKELQRYEV
jgi:cell volume regulation protein A